jgi:hypothetical protein
MVPGTPHHPALPGLSCLNIMGRFLRQGTDSQYLNQECPSYHISH